MPAIVRMTPRRWAHFSARVPVGTWVRGMNKEGGISWTAIALENYPFHYEEMLSGSSQRFYQSNMKYLHKDPCLVCQGIEETYITQFKMRYPCVQYFINGNWLTFDEIMALPSVRR